MFTPVYELSLPTKNHIYIKREDLYPFFLGGNKARIAQEYIDDLQRKGCDCLVGYGNTRSNLNRTLALAAAAVSIPFHTVSPSDDDGGRIETYNSCMAKICGAEIHECSKSNVSDTILSLMQDLTNKGYRPYYTNGNQYGKGNEEVPVGAYFKVYDEIKEQEKNLNICYDYVFLALGTGMTMAGLLVAQAQEKSCERIVGISVARESNVAARVVQNYCDLYCKRFGLDPVPYQNIHVLDDYRCGGYGKSSAEEEQLIIEMLKTNALPLDSTYTGKAFWGMNRYLQENGVSGRNVLFIHTGGTPLFYDYLGRNTQLNKLIIRTANSVSELLGFLREVDKLLPVALSSRVNLADYGKKVLEKGQVLFAEIDGVIAAVAIYYANDVLSHNGYLSLLVTKEQFRGRGIARSLMRQVERDLVDKKMQRLFLDTNIDNYPAISFYSALGYRVYKKLDKLQMVKELA